MQLRRLNILSRWQVTDPFLVGMEVWIGGFYEQKVSTWLRFLTE